MPLETHQKLLYRISSVLLSILLLAIVIEVGLRLMGAYMTHKVHVASARKRDATDFILCVGDSHTYGIGAAPALSYPAQLEALLNKQDRARTWQVVNLGMPGNNSSQTLQMVKGYLTADYTRPRLVIFCAGSNNEHNFANARIIPADLAGRGNKAWVKYLLANSRLFRMGQITVSRLEQVLGSIDKEGASALKYPLLETERPEERQLLQDWIFKDIQSLQEELKPRGITLVLLTYFRRCAWVNPVYEKASAELGIPVIDVYNFGKPEGTQIPVGKIYAAKDGHPNQYGYARIAEIVYKALLDRRLIPPPSAN